MSPSPYTSSNIPLLALYQDLRNKGLGLGIEELISAQKALQFGLAGDNTVSLRSLLKMLWLSCKDEFDIFDQCFERYLDETPGLSNFHPPKGKPSSQGNTYRSMEGALPSLEEASPESESEASDQEEISTQGVQEEASIALKTGTPSGAPEEIILVRHHDPSPALELRREWQQLEYEHASYTQLDLDLKATVKSIAHKGYFDEPVLRPRLQQDLNLLLFIDSGGSMLPMEDFCLRWRTNILKSIRVRQIRTGYFRNLPTEQVYEDASLQSTIPLRKFWGGLGTGKTVVLIISDLGAARKSWDSIRILDARDFSRRLAKKGFEQLWLNPMRRKFWTDTSAEKIAEKVPLLLSMSPEDTKEAIRYLNQRTKRRPQ